MPYEQTHTVGLAASRDALTDLSEAGRALDDVDFAVETLNAQIAELNRWLGRI